MYFDFTGGVSCLTQMMTSRNTDEEETGCAKAVLRKLIACRLVSIDEQVFSRLSEGAWSGKGIGVKGVETEVREKSVYISCHPQDQSLACQVTRQLQGRTVTGTHIHTHVHTYTLTHARTRTHAHARTHARTHTHTQTHTHTPTYTHIHVRMHTYTHASTHAHTHIHAHTHTHTSARAHTHIHTQTHTHKHTRMHARTHTHTHARTHARTPPPTHTHTHTHSHKWGYGLIE